MVDVSNVSTLSQRRSVAFFTAATGHLLTAGQRAGVAHHVALSIVGVDRVNYGYYEGKRVQEDLVLSGPVPASVLRATQFHEFPSQVLARSPGPVALVPRMRMQPVAAREVATSLVQLATGSPIGLAPELAGPQVLELVDLARQVSQATGRRRWVVPVTLPGTTGRAMATGGLRPTGPGPRGQQTFAFWLADTAGRIPAGSTGPGREPAGGRAGGRDHPTPSRDRRSRCPATVPAGVLPGALRCRRHRRPVRRSARSRAARPGPVAGTSRCEMVPAARCPRRAG